MANNTPFPTLPANWSALTWQQLCQVWSVKQRYGGNADVARAAALLTLVCGEGYKVKGSTVDTKTGEEVYTLAGSDGRLWTVTPRELAYLAKETLPWVDYPYGDNGDKEERDEKGKVIKERREGHAGYVSGMRDAMILPIETISVNGARVRVKGERRPLTSCLLPLTSKHFSLPEMACFNLTWQQYRSLQAITPQLWQEGITDEEFLDLQAQFMSHILVPRSFAILDTNGGSIRIRPHYEYRYNAEQAEEMVKWWRKRLSSETVAVLYRICYQVYQTALEYYALSYPLLFQDSGKSDTLKDALTGEVSTINTIMKYAGYAEQQQVYDSNLPFVLDILNTMTKEAKEIEKMNAKIKRKN